MDTAAYSRLRVARAELYREAEVVLQDGGVRAIAVPLGQALHEAPPINHDMPLAAALDGYPAGDVYDLLAVEVVNCALHDAARRLTAMRGPDRSLCR